MERDGCLVLPVLVEAASPALDQGSDSPWVKEEEVPRDTSECETGESRKTLG